MNKGDEEILQHGKKHIQVPLTVDCLQGILTVIPMQLLSFHIAMLRGYDVRKSAHVLMNSLRILGDGDVCLLINTYPQKPL